MPQFGVNMDHVAAIRRRFDRSPDLVVQEGSERFQTSGFSFPPEFSAKQPVQPT